MHIYEHVVCLCVALRVYIYYLYVYSFLCLCVGLSACVTRSHVCVCVLFHSCVLSSSTRLLNPQLTPAYHPFWWPGGRGGVGGWQAWWRRAGAGTYGTRAT